MPALAPLPDDRIEAARKLEVAAPRGLLSPRSHERGRVPLRYLGSKARLASQIAIQINRWRTPSVVFDLFAGMGHVSAAFTGSTPVYAVDASPAAATVLAWRLTSLADPRIEPGEEQRIQARFDVRIRILRGIYGDVLKAETAWLRDPSAQDALKVERAYGSLPGETRMRGPDSVVTGYFGHAYFGVSQAIEFDALRAALRDALGSGEISPSAHQWGLVALLCAATHLTNAPGHFAQHFALTGSSALRAAQQMRRSVWSQWKRELALLEPAGSPAWRLGNRVERRDSLEPWHVDAPGGACFADPPYTASQYSRFYHVLDTLVQYDVPACNYGGRYRDDRYKSPFCRKREVASALGSLMHRAIEIAPVLYLTYPSDGLLHEAGGTVHAVARTAGLRALRIASQTLLHAAPGSGGGKRSVIEEIWKIYV